MFESEQVSRKYSRVARIYDLTMPVFAIFGFNKAARARAVKALELRPGDTVLELGCGTGLNFPFLEEAVGPNGRILGLDLTAAMLAEARKRIERHGWRNIELIEADVLQTDLPPGVDGILAAGVMQLLPDHDAVIRKCAEALSSGKRLVILDGTPATGAWAFLNSLFERLTRGFAVSHEGWRRQPWEEMREHLTDVTVKRSGPFMYLAVGTKD